MDRAAQRELNKRERKKEKARKKSAATARKEKAEATKLKPFRQQLEKLKKAGVLPADFDARKAKPTKRLQKKLKDFAAVAKGTATALPLSKPQWRKHYREQGHVVRDGFAIIDNAPGHKYSVEDRGIKTSRLEGRYETIELPLSNKSLEKFLHELEFNKKFEKLKQPKERWAFRFYGNNSRRVFQTLAQMVDYLSQYETIDKALAKKGRARNRTEIINAVEIVRIKAGYTEDQWRGAPNKQRDFKEQNRAYKEKMGRRFSERPKSDKSAKGRWQRWKHYEPLRYQDKLRDARRRMRKLRKKRQKQKG